MNQIIVVFLVFCFSIFVFAQEETEEDRPWKWGLTTGQFLPFGIVGVRSNYTWHGLRLIRPVKEAYILHSIFFSQGKGVTFYNFDSSFQMDFDLMDYQFAIYVGFDINHYKRKRSYLREYPFVTLTGGHIGWAVFGDMGDGMRFRFDCKNKFGPGRSAFVGIGLEFDFGSGESEEE